MQANEAKLADRLASIEDHLRALVQTAGGDPDEPRLSALQSLLEKTPSAV